MATVNGMLSAGIPAAQGDAINGNTALVSAAGTVLADATGISGDAICTVGATSAGIRLPASAKIGDKLYFANVCGNTLKIWPSAAADTINALSAGGEISIATQKSCIFWRQSATQWRTIPLVPS